jgi:hypothetical protein
MPAGTFAGYGAAFAACAFAFAAAIVGTEPKVIVWPEALAQPAKLMLALASDKRTHRVFCEQPRWCDGAHADFANIHPLLDDRAGWADAAALRAQRDAVATKGTWRAELSRAHVDAVIAKSDANIVALLSQTGWQRRSTDGVRVLLVPEGVR